MKESRLALIDDESWNWTCDFASRNQKTTHTHIVHMTYIFVLMESACYHVCECFRKCQLVGRALNRLALASCPEFRYLV